MDATPVDVEPQKLRKLCDHVRCANKTVRVVAHQCGLKGSRVGEASNPGPNRRRPTRRPVEGRDVHRRISTQLDSDSDAALVLRIPSEELLDDLERDVGTVVDSNFDALFANSGRFHVLSSGGDEEPLVPVTSSTVPASSRAQPECCAKNPHPDCGATIASMEGFSVCVEGSPSNQLPRFREVLKGDPQG